MNNIMVEVIEQLRGLDEGILKEFWFESLIKIDPMYMDMPISNMGMSFRKAFSDNMNWFLEFLNLLLDPRQIYMKIKQYAENIKPEPSPKI